MSKGQIHKNPKEDAWAWVDIGSPFPDGPVRVQGQQNQYVALWYKNGKPLHGRAWNNGGVVDCSFPFNGAELTGKASLGGKIQILSFESWREEREAWNDCGYTYDWVPWKEARAGRPLHMQLVRCGNVTPVLMVGTDGQTYCGNLDMNTETASVSYGGKAVTITTGIDKLMTIVRDLREPIVHVVPPVKLEYFDVWTDLKEGDDMARARYPVKALGRALNTPNGPREEFVALWYKHGKPCSGCIWNNAGKIAAEFTAADDLHNTKVGSLQVLTHHPLTSGFKLAWKTYKEAMAKGNGWWAVRVNDTAPCVVRRPDGTERLGKVELSLEKASIANKEGTKAEHFTGPQVQAFMVLCRDSPVPGAHYPEDAH